jgi:hypothetical protein
MTSIQNVHKYIKKTKHETRLTLIIDLIIYTHRAFGFNCAEKKVTPPNHTHHVHIPAQKGQRFVRKHECALMQS